MVLKSGLFVPENGFSNIPVNTPAILIGLSDGK